MAASTHSRSERPVAVTQRSSARYRHWPFRCCSSPEAELAVFAGRRAWVTGDGPKAIFADAVGWLRDRDVLLPGVSRLAGLVARERDAATQRLRERLYAAL